MLYLCFLKIESFFRDIYLHIERYDGRGWLQNNLPGEGKEEVGGEGETK